MRITTAALGAALVLASAGGVPAQDAENGRPETLRVFLDCHGPCGDFDYIRREIPFVSYVRNREDAHVHILVTSQGTGGGGARYSLQFIGRGPFDGEEFELRETSASTDVYDEIRARLVRTVKLGLVRFAAATALADRLQVRWLAPDAAPDAPAGRTAENQVREQDPWNNWVFSIRGNGFMFGESSYNSRYLNGGVSVNQTTPIWKHSLSVSGSLNRSSQTYALTATTDTTYVVETYSYSSSAQTVRAVAPHWSVGGRTAASASSRVNQDYTFSAGPAIEYSVFPYEESDRRQVTFVYAAGVRYIDYTEITLFNKMYETLGGHQLTVSYNATQPWGSAHVQVDGSQYFHDPGLYSVEVSGGFNLRIFRGLSFNVGGSWEWIRDQIYLPAASEDLADVLLQRQQLATDYSFNLNFGLNFRFGSTFNNVVNPRLGGGSGRFF